MNELNPEISSAEIEMEVPFHDVDAMNITWHGHYVRYLELARCKLFDQFDYNYRQMEASGYSWPVIDLQLRYVQPSRFQQKIKIKATIKEWENRLRIEYIIRDSESGQRLTKARTDQVAVDLASGEMQFASPDILLFKLGLLDKPEQASQGQSNNDC